MTTQEVLEDFSLPLNPVHLTSPAESPTLKAWPMDHSLLLISIVHAASTTNNQPPSDSCPEPNWEEVSQRLQSCKTSEVPTIPVFFTPKECERQYNHLMSTVDSLVEGEIKPKRLQSVSSKREILLRSIAAERVKVSEKKEIELRKEIEKVGKRIYYLNSGGLDDNLAEISDSGGTDSESEEVAEMSHPFEDSDSFIEHLKRAFNLTDDSLLNTPLPTNVAVAVDLGVGLNSENLRSSSPPTYSTMEFKKVPTSGQAVSPQLKNLVHSAIAGAAQEDKTKNVSPTSAPTLSMLLEMPPRDRGQPLPQIQLLIGTSNASSVDSLNNYFGQTSSPIQIKQENPSKAHTALGTSLSPIKTIPQNPGRREGVGLPGLTLTMPLKTQEEIEIANDFVISSGLVQEVAETYELDNSLPHQVSVFPSGNPEPAKCASILSSSSQSFKFSEDNANDHLLIVPGVSSEADKSVKTLEVPSNKVAEEGSNLISDSNSCEEPPQLNAPSEVLAVVQVEVTLPDQDTAEDKQKAAEIQNMNEESIPALPSVESIKVERESSAHILNAPEDKEKIEERPCEILSDEPVQSMIEGNSEKGKGVENKATNPDDTKEEIIDVLFDSRDKLKTGSGRGKKSLHEKAEDTSSVPLTRNSIREKGVKLEETAPLVKKLVKDIPTPSSTIVSRRSITRAGAIDDVKPAGDIPLSPNKVYGTGLRKPIHKVPEAHTPNLRSRRGPTPTPVSSPGDEYLKTGGGKTVSVKKDPDAIEPEGKDKEKVDSDASSPHKEVVVIDKERLSPRKQTTDKEKAKELVVKSDDESNEEQSDAPVDDDSRAMSGIEDESCDNDDMSKKKRFKASPRKERSESGEMADDDNSNSAFDGNQKKRLTRRSAKVSPQKSDGKSRDNSADGNSSKDPDTPSGKDSKTRQSKTMSRLKHLNEEAQQLFGDIDVKEEDDNGKRITRARAKTSTSPGAKIKSSGSSKTNNTGENEASSEAERGPSRATRSRAAASGSGSASHSVIESMPPVHLDSNPSSPSSSTTNSTILEEDRDQRAFRKSIMLIWNRIAAHKFASVFMKPITDEAIPGYSKKVKRPMDLITIKRNIETGAIRMVKTFERDLYLMYLNAIMFNPRTHSIVSMAKDMENDTSAILEDYKNTQKLLKSAQEGSEESNKKEESDADQEPQEEEKPKNTSAKAAGRKRRNRSTSVGNSDEPVEGKRRTLRTSTTAATTAASAWQGSRKGKHQISPDIVSSGRLD